LRSDWFKGNKDNKVQIKSEYEASTFIFGVLDQILKDKINKSNKEMRDPDMILSPTWSDQVLHHLAYQRALTEVQELLRSKT